MDGVKKSDPFEESQDDELGVFNVFILNLLLLLLL
jgi:hypothetical protein